MGGESFAWHSEWEDFSCVFMSGGFQEVTFWIGDVWQ